MNAKQATHIIDFLITIFSVIVLVITGFALQKAGLYNPASWKQVAVFFAIGMYIMRRITWQIYEENLLPLLLINDEEKTEAIT